MDQSKTQHKTSPFSKFSRLRERGQGSYRKTLPPEQMAGLDHSENSVHIMLKLLVAKGSCNLLQHFRGYMIDMGCNLLLLKLSSIELKLLNAATAL